MIENQYNVVVMNDSLQDQSESVPYLAPEVRQGSSQTVESDVFSFGLFLLQLITGSEAQGLIQYVESAVRSNRLNSILDPCAEGISSAPASALVDLALK